MRGSAFQAELCTPAKMTLILRPRPILSLSCSPPLKALHHHQDLKPPLPPRGLHQGHAHQLHGHHAGASLMDRVARIGSFHSLACQPATWPNAIVSLGYGRPCPVQAACSPPNHLLVRINTHPTTPPRPKGLEDQLLGKVVRHERADLEEARDRLVVSIAADTRQLQARVQGGGGRGERRCRSTRQLCALKGCSGLARERLPRLSLGPELKAPLDIKPASALTPGPRGPHPAAAA